jgi:hypothetical protein
MSARDLASMSDSEMLHALASWREAARSADPAAWLALHGCTPSLNVEALDRLESEARAALMREGVA